MKNVIVLLMLSAATAGCDSDVPVTPTGPTGPAAPPAVPVRPQETLSVRGGVADSAYRPLPGARVEVLSGPRAGQSAFADSTGDYSFVGPFDEGTEFRATKDGYAAARGTLRDNPHCPTCSKWFLYFVLDVPTPPVNIAGDYTFTLAADSACELPSEARTRTYTAAIRPIPREDGSRSTSFNVTFPGASFLEDYSSFQIHVAGDYVSFNLEDSHGPWLVEQLAPNTYIAVGGEASLSVSTPVSTISTSFRGTIGYCEGGAKVEGFYDCSALKPVAFKACTSPNHRLMLRRR